MTALPPLRDARIGYVSEISSATRRLWETVEANRRAFLREATGARRDRLLSLVNPPTTADLAGLSPAAAAHVRFCFAVAARSQGAER